MTDIKLFRPDSDEVVDLGLESQSADDVLEIGAMVATFDPNVIVYAEGTTLQEWK